VEGEMARPQAHGKGLQRRAQRSATPLELEVSDAPITPWLRAISPEGIKGLIKLRSGL
jgi:hypothetical protein